MPDRSNANTAQIPMIAMATLASDKETLALGFLFIFLILDVMPPLSCNHNNYYTNYTP